MIHRQNDAMSVPMCYLETSVWGSLAPRQPRDRKQVVHRLLRLLDGVHGQCVISDVVLTEIEEASPKMAEQILKYVNRAQPTIHPISEAIESLAAAYIAAGVLPEGREADALHVAAATSLQLDFLVSWNHRHMTRPRKRLQFESVSRLHGFLKTPPAIHSRHVMKLEIEEFLDHIDEWKFKLHEKLKGMSPAQRKAFWNQAHERARARGLNVVEPEKPAKRPSKRVRRTG